MASESTELTALDALSPGVIRSTRFQRLAGVRLAVCCKVDQLEAGAFESKISIKQVEQMLQFHRLVLHTASQTTATRRVARL